MLCSADSSSEQDPLGGIDLFKTGQIGISHGGTMSVGRLAHAIFIHTRLDHIR